MDKATIYLKN